MSTNPYVMRVRPLEDYRLEVVFENGERRIFQVKPFLRHGVFICLQDRVLFRAARVVAGSVEWPAEVDLSYDTLYLESQPIGEQVIVDGDPAPLALTQRRGGSAEYLSRVDE